MNHDALASHRSPAASAPAASAPAATSAATGAIVATGALSEVSTTDKAILVGIGFGVGTILAALGVEASRRRADRRLRDEAFFHRKKANILSDVQKDLFEQTGDPHHNAEARYWKGDAEATWRIERKLRGLD